jgi:hypothetical protein
MNQYPFADNINTYLTDKRSPIPGYLYYTKFIEIFRKAYAAAPLYQYKLTEREKLLLFNVLDDILFEMDLDTN